MGWRSKAQAETLLVGIGTLWLAHRGLTPFAVGQFLSPGQPLRAPVPPFQSAPVCCSAHFLNHLGHWSSAAVNRNQKVVLSLVLYRKICPDPLRCSTFARSYVGICLSYPGWFCRELFPLFLTSLPSGPVPVQGCRQLPFEPQFFLWATPPPPTPTSVELSTCIQATV